MSKLEIINKFLFQFLFIRICKSTENKYGILYFVLPFTGWNNNYVPIGKIKIKMF